MKTQNILQPSNNIPSATARIFEGNLPREYVWLGLMFILSLVMRYAAPLFVGDIFFYLLLLYFVLDSKNEVRNLVLLFILTQAPGFLFYQLGSYALPSLKFLGTGRELAYPELINILLLLKAISRKPHYRLIFRTYFIVILVFFFVQLINSIYIGTTITRLLRAVRTFLPYAMLYSLPRLLRDENCYERFFFLVSPFVFLSVAAQISDIIVGRPWGMLIGESTFFLGGTAVVSELQFDVAGEAYRNLYGPYLILYSFIFSTIYYEYTIHKNYCLYVFFASFLGITLSATRGWLIASIIMMFLFFLLSRQIKTVSSISKLVLIMFVIIISLSFMPYIGRQIDNTIQRLSTLQSLYKGDVTADGTLSRLSERAPRVLGKFIERPLLGFGFSEEYFSYTDQHVGHHDMLLNVGIIGYILINMLYLFMIFNSIFAMNRKGFDSKKYGAIFMGLVGILVIHSSSRSMYGFYIPFENIFLLAIIISYFSMLHSRGA